MLSLKFRSSILGGGSIELKSNSRDKKDNTSFITAEISKNDDEKNRIDEKIGLLSQIKNFIQKMMKVRTSKTIYIPEKEINNIIKIIQEGDNTENKYRDTFWGKIILMIVLLFGNSQKVNLTSKTPLTDYDIYYANGRFFVSDRSNFKLEITDLQINYSNNKFAVAVNTDKGDLIVKDSL